MVADRDGDARPRAGIEHRLRIRFRKRERLFAKHVLARAGRRFHLRAMPGVRRRQHDGLDRGIGQHLLVGRADLQPRCGEIAR